MAPQQKGKQATKGAKQIVEENRSTLTFYRNMGLGSAAASIIVNAIFFEISKVTVLMSILTIVALTASYQFMKFMSQPKYMDSGALLDSGSDLNMEGGIAEHVKDLVILSSGTMLLALISNYFWFLLLLAPGRAIWMLWRSVIQPWLIQRNASQEQTQVDEKKQRKMERKMRRMR